MGDVLYRGFFESLLAGDLDGAPDIRLLLCGTDFTGESETGSVNVADLTDLDEWGATGYQQIDCDNVDFSWDASAGELQLTFDADEFNASGGTVAPFAYDAEYLVAKLYVDGTAANDVILASTDSGGFPINGVNTAITYTPDAEGLIYVEQAP